MEYQQLICPTCNGKRFFVYSFDDGEQAATCAECGYYTVVVEKANEPTP